MSEESINIALDILDVGYTTDELAAMVMAMSDEIVTLRSQIVPRQSPSLQNIEIPTNNFENIESDELLLPKKAKCEIPSSPEAAKLRLKFAVKYFYDIQRLRMQAAGRYLPKAPTAQVDLSEADQLFFEKTSVNLNALEKQALKEVTGLLKHFPISEWLLEQRGLGPTMAGVIIMCFDIHRAHTPSSLWAVSGLNVVDGKAPRPKKGEKLKYNAWLRTKMVGVMAGNFLKTNSPWRKFYDDYKHRKECQIVETCWNCEGSGKLKGESCANCEGGKKPAPWGKSKGHRHNAALRYMVKMFLNELYDTWRKLENLPVRVPYQQEYLGHTHH